MIPTTVDFEIVKSAGLDVWGEPIAGETIFLKGNLRSQTKTVENSYGDEVVSEYQVLFVGFVDVNQEDEIRFTEANGEAKEFQPITVKHMRDLDGSVGFTKVAL